MIQFAFRQDDRIKNSFPYLQAENTEFVKEQVYATFHSGFFLDHKQTVAERGKQLTEAYVLACVENTVIPRLDVHSMAKSE